MVPPEKPAYRIRRVWLSREEEEQGYYYGFANEGLWPLCHIAHTRPVFRAAGLGALPHRESQRSPTPSSQEARTEDPIVLVQDYHFALLPRMIRERLPRATIITFWHIPWPNPEAFGICPWREEILDGLLGSLDPRLPHAVPLQQLLRHGRPLPRSARRPRDLHHLATAASRPRCTATRSRSSGRRRRCASQTPVDECRERVRERARPRAGRAHRRRRRPARLHQGHPRALRARSSACSSSSRDWIGQFTFVQIAAPSRSSIEEYQDLDARVRAPRGTHQRRASARRTASRSS